MSSNSSTYSELFVYLQKQLYGYEAIEIQNAKGLLEKAP